MAYSLREAAAAVGMGKPAILKAIQKGRISGSKNDLGEWEIEPAELHRVYKPVSRDALETASKPGSLETDATIGSGNGTSLLGQEVRFLHQRLADLERVTDTERRQLSERIEDLKGERDRLLTVIEDQTATVKLLTDQRQPTVSDTPTPLPAPQQVAPKGLRGWLHRLTG